MSVTSRRVARSSLSMTASSIHICHCESVTEPESGEGRPSAVAISAGVIVVVSTGPPSCSVVLLGRPLARCRLLDRLRSLRDTEPATPVLVHQRLGNPQRGARG